jgi:hypothetical protein
MNPKTVADRLGHADPAITLRVYTANTNAQAQAAAESLEAGLNLPEITFNVTLAKGTTSRDIKETELSP